jgi:aminoglycoside phosphotransferase (APT) family kinase protein
MTRSDIAIPRGPDQVTPDWMSTALSTEDGPTSIDNVQIAAVGTGQAGATYRVSVRYNANPTQLPATFVVKLSSQRPEIREKVSPGYRVEHAFYTLLARHLDVPIPRAYHCEISADALDFALIMADETPAEPGDQIQGCSPAQARLAARAIAGLHGPLWCDPTIADFPYTVMPKPSPESASMLGEVMNSASELALNEIGHLLTEQDRATFVDATALTETWLLLEPDRYSVLHGDYRIDNLLFTPDDSRVSIVDWQSLTVGLPARDLTYFTATSMQPELRREMERELVLIYHQSLRTYCVSGYDLETCWHDYRLGALQATLICGLGAAFTPAPNERAERMIVAMMSRACQAIRELESLELIRQKSSCGKAPSHRR